MCTTGYTLSLKLPRKLKKGGRGILEKEGVKKMTKAKNLFSSRENPSRADHHHPSLNRDCNIERIYACGQWPKYKAKLPATTTQQNITENEKRII